MTLAWSKIAVSEITELRRFSTDRWGRAVAARYLEDIRDTAKAVAADPLSSRKLRGEFRIRRVRSHYLIVHIDQSADTLTVARVLHTAMDIERHLDPGS